MSADIISILGDIGIEEYDNTKNKGKGIKHTFKYRSQSGHLEGVSAGEDQEISVTLSAGESIKEIQILLGAILERHATFGPLYQYPKIFVIGPNMLKSDIFKAVGDVKLPYVRDVDRIIWIKKKAEGTFDWGVINLFHNYRSVFQTVKTTSIQYSNYTNATEKKTLVESILKGSFSDAGQFIFALSHSSAQLVQNVNHFEILWMLQKIAIERSPDYSEEVDEQAGTMMKKLALLGTIPFVEPVVNGTQSEHPVPIGALKIERMAAISDFINQTREVKLSLIDLDSGPETEIDETNFFSSSDEPADSSDDFEDWGDWE